MKITNNMRDAFVRAVLQDVPTVDYNAEFKNFAVELCLARLPGEIVRIYKNNSLRGFLKFETVNIRAEYYESEVSAALPLYDTYSTVKADLAATPEVQAITKAKQAQADRLCQLRQDLRAAIQSVSTVKQALELLPEFAKYLPKPDDKPIKFAPAVIANLATNLTAAGWPKDQKKEAKAA